MRAIVHALDYIDEELVFAALQTRGAGKRAVGAGERPRADSVKRERGGVRVRAAVIAVSAVAAAALCVVFALWAKLVLTGAKSSDGYYQAENVMTFESFSELSALYPDSQMSERLASFGGYAALTGIELCYDGDDWQSAEGWYSLILSWYGDAVTEDGVYERGTIRCLFTGTLEDWRVDSVFDRDTRLYTFGETEVQLSYSAATQCSYAIFEKNRIVYDIRLQSGDSTEEDLLATLEFLLQ